MYSILSDKSSDNKYQVQLGDDCQDFLHYNNTMGGFYFSCDGTNYSNLAICKKSVFWKLINRKIFLFRNEKHPTVIA